MATTMQRTSTPERWQAAARRAIAGEIRVMQVEATGQWIATSGRDQGVAYALEVTGNVAHGCSCPAGLNDDPVCRHRAAWYVAAGVLDPEPDPPAPIAAVLTLEPCATCRGTGEIRMQTGDRLNDYWSGLCRQCDGTGKIATEGEGSPDPSPDHRCACNRGRLTLAFDYFGPTVVARLVCAGCDGVRSCGYGSPPMTMAEVAAFEDLRFARQHLDAAAVPLAS